MKHQTTPYLAYSTNTFQRIPQVQQLSQQERHEIDVVSRVLPFKVNSYVVDNLIDWTRYKSDPMYVLVFPQRDMLREDHFTHVERLLHDGVSGDVLKHEVEQIRRDLNPHPSAQLHNVPTINDNELPGVQHKYRETVLFFPSQGQTCHAYCTFCFRWPQFVGMHDIKFAAKEIDTLISYLREHTEVTDILFTGGDPMIMRTAIFAQYVEALLREDLPHIQTIRIGTKALGYWPYRFTHDADAQDLLKLFERVVRSGRNLFIMAHFNHYVELLPPAQREAAMAILKTGAQIRTQSPVLRHINDEPAVWARMWREQVNQNMIPYYMFVERDTGPKQYFELPLEQAWHIFRTAYQQVSGVCRTVRGPVMSSAPGKIQVLGTAEVHGEHVFVLRFLQGRNPDWAAKPFFAKYDPHATWLDDLRPAFDEQRFFFTEELNTILGTTSESDDEFYAFE